MEKWVVEKSGFPGLYDVYDEDGNRVVTHTTIGRANLIAAAPTIPALRTAIQSAEQTLRNLGTGFLTGDPATIALSAAANLSAAIAS